MQLAKAFGRKIFANEKNVYIRSIKVIGRKYLMNCSVYGSAIFFFNICFFRGGDILPCFGLKYFFQFHNPLSSIFVKRSPISWMCFNLYSQVNNSLTLSLLSFSLYCSLSLYTVLLKIVPISGVFWKYYTDNGKPWWLIKFIYNEYDIVKCCILAYPLFFPTESPYGGATIIT